MNRYSRYIGALLAAALMDPVCVVQAYNNPLPVPLLTAGTYYALAYSGITGSATVQGDIGTTTAAIDVTVVQTGTNYGIGGSHNAQAQTDLAAALTDAFGRTPDATISAALGGQTLTRGVYVERRMVVFDCIGRMFPFASKSKTLFLRKGRILPIFYP